MISFRFGKIFGIALELHGTFVLMLLAIGVFLAIFDPQNLVPNIGFLALLFVSVFIHELCHCIVAISKGVKVSKITLLPIGGISVTEEMPQKPMDEFLIALAGPLFNFAVVGLVLVLGGIFPHLLPDISMLENLSAESLDSLLFAYPLFAVFWVNFLLGAFNLFVPALPLDGGRIFRALLATRLGFDKATGIAANVSKIISIGLFVLGFFSGNIILLLVAAFIFFGANQENDLNAIKQSLKGFELKKAFMKRPFKLSPELTVDKAIEKMLEKRQTVMLVDSAEPSFVSIEALQQVAKTDIDFVKVSEIARRVHFIKPDFSLEKAFMLMASKGQPFLAVRQNGKIAGILFDEEIHKIIAIKKATKGK